VAALSLSSQKWGEDRSTIPTIEQAALIAPSPDHIKRMSPLGHLLPFPFTGGAAAFPPKAVAPSRDRRGGSGPGGDI